MNKKYPRYNEIIFTEKQEKDIIDMYVTQRMPTTKIGKKYNVSYKTICRLLDRNNIPRTSLCRRKYGLDEEYFDNIDSQNKAYILGFLSADGCNNMAKQTVSMALQEDDYSILESIRIEMKSERPLEYIDYSNKHDFGYTYKNQYRLLLFSAHMCESLNRLGVTPSKSLSFRMPDINKNLYSHFIRGLFDGDGSINKTRSLVTITGTKYICDKISEILKNEGIESHISDASNNNGITKVLIVSKTYSVNKFLSYIYQDSNLKLKRKYDIYVSRYLNN